MKPYLTIVATARNDDHGGNLLHRMQIFVSGLLKQCQQFQLNAELVLVEWNPPPDRPKLPDALCWPAYESNPCSVRIIEVSSEVHGRFQYSEQLPLFQMIAKNVGIRRAQGQYILVTNIDILFSGELIQFLASNKMKPGQMYRLDRYDVPSDIPKDVPIDKQLEYCRQNIMRINRSEGTYNLRSKHYHPIYPKPTLYSVVQEKIQDWGLRPVYRRSRLHTNGCGDFTLMKQDHWLDLRGYPEFEMYSLHLDAVFCHAAHHGVARERVLRDPMRIYHIEHAKGSGWTPEGEDSLSARLKASNVPQLEHSQFDTWALQMRSERKPIIFNDKSWGLANESLPETIVF